MFTMRVLGPLVSLLVSSVIAGDDFNFADCSKEGAHVETCAQKVDSDCMQGLLLRGDVERRLWQWKAGD
jgi:hypothetical protein